MGELFNDRPPTPEVLTRESNVNEIDSFLRDIFEERDGAFLSGRAPRTELLDAGIVDLSILMMKNPETTNQKLKEDLIARIVSRVFCMARSMPRLSVAEGLSEKFPLKGCSYCGQMPCGCLYKDRLPPDLSPPSSEQIDWTLIDWQGHLLRTYGERNEKLGIYFVLCRLTSERRELNSLESQAPSMSIEEIRRELRLELADTLAWTIGAANVIGVNVQDAVVGRYGLGCSICKERPCICKIEDHNLKRFNGKSFEEIESGAPF